MFSANARIILASACLSIAALGCGDESSTSSIDCETATVPTFAQVSIFDTCTACHSSTLSGPDRANAPEGVNYDTLAAARANAEEGMSEVEGGDMPPSGYDVTDAEKQAFYAWTQCGTLE